MSTFNNRWKLFFIFSSIFLLKINYSYSKPIAIKQMNTTSIENLTSNEVILLKKHIEIQKANLIRIGLIFIGVAIASFFIVSISTNFWYAGLTTSLSWIGVSGLIFFLFIYPNYLKIKSDLTYNQKEIVQGVINHKEKRVDEHGDDYFLYIGINKDGIEISESDYHQLNEGDRIEAHRALHSKIILNINRIN